MREADILALTYEDSCTISRKTNAIKDPATKQTRQDACIVAENLSCSLSHGSGGGIHFGDGHGSFTKGYLLFCRPEVDIRAGDKVVVTTKAGRTHILWAGIPAVYAGNSAQTPLSEDERS